MRSPQSSIRDKESAENSYYSKDSPIKTRNPVQDDRPLRNIDKVMIPYDFTENKYIIKDEDIKWFESRDYLKSKLKEFGGNPLFNFEEKFNPEGCFKIFIFDYLPIVLIFLIYFYISFFLAVYTFFNLGVIYICFIIGRKLKDYIQIKKYSLWDKYKIQRVMKVLNEENERDECRGRNIKWDLGPSGYWLEVKTLDS